MINYGAIILINISFPFEYNISNMNEILQNIIFQICSYIGRCHHGIFNWK